MQKVMFPMTLCKKKKKKISLLHTYQIKIHSYVYLLRIFEPHMELSLTMLGLTIWDYHFLIKHSESHMQTLISEIHVHCPSMRLYTSQYQKTATTTLEVS